MKIQITKNDYYLKHYWGVRLWSVHQVLQRAVRKEKKQLATWYKISATILYESNCTGSKTQIWIRNNECTIIQKNHHNESLHYE